MKRTLTLLLTLAVGVLTPDAVGAPKAKTPETALAKSRVVLCDVAPKAPAELCDTDLGATPAPGSSRLISRDDVVAALPEGTPMRGWTIPASTRIVRKTRTVAPVELEKITRRAVTVTGLPRGASLAAVRAKASVTVPDGWDTVSIEVPRPPRKSGKHLATATLVFSEGESVLIKVPVPIEMMLPKSAAQPDIKKGSKVSFVISRGSIEIKASATATQDADVGETLNVALESGKMAKATLTSKDPALAMEAP
jgi:hypothetical protein